MFDIFKKDIEVKCYDLEELAKLLDWLRAQYLSRMSQKHFLVIAVTNNIFEAFETRPEVLYFIVKVPYVDYKKLREKFIEQEAFDPVLEQRAISEILGRGL